MKEKFIISIGLLIILALISSTTYAQQQTVYSLNMVIYKNDTVVLKNITAINGVPGEFSEQGTDYTIKVFSYQDLELFSDNLQVSFFLSLDPIGVIETNSTFVHVNIPYFPTATSIAVYHLDKKILDIDLHEEFCNKNNICDLGENEYDCPEDCKKEEVSVKLPWIYLIVGLIVVVIIAVIIIIKRQPKKSSSDWEKLYQKWK